MKFDKPRPNFAQKIP